jgi:solute:Na+ symporter, SSS family
VLVGMLFGWSLTWSVILGTTLSVVYVYSGGFRSVLKTDGVQFTLMYSGFAVLVGVLWWQVGSVASIWDRLPATHTQITGGQSWSEILVWYFIALATLIEPAFYQRCYAAKDGKIARRGILVSVGFWLLFDLLTTTSGLYAAALYKDLADPVSSFPTLAADYLPAGLLGFFWITLFAVVMSTVESYMFVASVTGGRDLWLGFEKRDPASDVTYTRRALFPVAILAVVLALYFQSVVELWYIVGTVSTPALLLPVLTTFYPRHRFTSRAALLNIVLAGGVALAWELVRSAGQGTGPFGVPGIYVGLTVSLVIWLWGRTTDPATATKEISA